MPLVLPPQQAGEPHLQVGIPGQVAKVLGVDQDGHVSQGFAGEEPLVVAVEMEGFEYEAKEAPVEFFLCWVFPALVNVEKAEGAHEKE